MVAGGHRWGRDGFRFWVTAQRERGPGGGSVHPADRHPLGLRAQLLHGSLELPEGPFQVAVDQAEVKVVAIPPLDAAALFHCPPQVRLLPGTRGQCPQLTPIIRGLQPAPSPKPNHSGMDSMAREAGAP